MLYPKVVTSNQKLCGEACCAGCVPRDAGVVAAMSRANARNRQHTRVLLDMLDGQVKVVKIMRGHGTSILEPTDG